VYRDVWGGRRAGRLLRGLLRVDGGHISGPCFIEHNEEEVDAVEDESPQVYEQALHGACELAQRPEAALLRVRLCLLSHVTVTYCRKPGHLPHVRA